MPGQAVELHPTSEREHRTAARRPKFSALSNQRIESLGLEAMPPLDRALRLYFAAREKLLSSARA